VLLGIGVALCAGSCGSQSRSNGLPDEPVVAAIDAGPVVAEVVETPRPAGHRISPDGAFLSYVVHDGDTSALWIAPTAEPEAARALSIPGSGPITAYAWAFTNRHIVYERSNRVSSVDVQSGAVADLTPPEAGAAAIHGLGHERPEHVMVAGDLLYRVHIATGAHVVAQQDAGFDGYYVDSSLRARIAYRADGDARVLFHVGRRGAWTELGRVSSVVGFDQARNDMLVLASTALLSVDLATGNISDLAAGVDRVLLHPRTGSLQAYTVGREWVVADDDMAATLRRLVLLLGEHIEIVSRALDDDLWLVSDGTAVYLFDRSSYTLDPV
jgi:hypothetical protein